MEAGTTINIGVCHNEPFVAAGLVEKLRRQRGFKLDSSLIGDSQLDQLVQSRADVVVADYESALRLLTVARRPRDRHGASAKVLILSGRETESEIRHAFKCGVYGYHILGGKPDDLFEGVRSVHRGTRYLCPAAARSLAQSVGGRDLTGRESDVLRLVTEGCCNKTVARRLAIAPDTVKGHMKAIFQKLEADNRTEAAAVAQRRGLLKQPGARV
ncbi:MAG TPA: response regulator transcription factor [Duganella sp.]|uniref:response regulator transcription factor n=1 Tax=Duganella sp. TaxID=1904440 RepID=UPI002ED49F8B